MACSPSDSRAKAVGVASGTSSSPATDPSVSTPNLNALLAEYGMSPMEGLVVEGDAGHHAQGYASATLTPGQLEVRFHKVKPLQQGQAPASPLLHTTRITLPAGSTSPVVH